MSTRCLRAALPLVLLSIRIAAAADGQLDTNPTLFTVFAALNISGYDAGLHAPVEQNVRQQMRNLLARKNLSCREELQRFLAQRHKADPGAEMSQYVSFALSVDGPPNFNWKVPRSEIPPDALPLDGLGPLLARFYSEADIERLYKSAQPLLEQALVRYQAPINQALLDVNAYLRSPSNVFAGRRFQVYVEPQAEPNQSQSRQYGDDYFIILSLANEPQVDPVRHMFLHYLLDPLAAKYRDDWAKKRGLGDYAQGSSLLDDSFKSDFLLLATECLIKAVEARLAPASQRAALVQQALREGYVITPYFSEVLPAYEKQQLSMRLFYQDMVKSIDLVKEAERLDKVEFTNVRTARKPKGTPPPPPALSPAEKTVEEAEQFYAERSLDQAKAKYKRALELTDQRPLQARCYYGLARIAAIEKDPELAERLFQKVLDSEPDSSTRSWSYVFLARLAQQHSEGDPAEVTRLYQAALAVEGASPAARKAAEEGLKRAGSGAANRRPEP